MLRYDFLFQFTPKARRQQLLIEALHEFTDKVIVARREKLLSGNAEVSEHGDDVYGGRKKMALLDILLQSKVDGKFLTNEDIREEIDTFMFEVFAIALCASAIMNSSFFHCQGHDTTNSALAFTLYNIAKHREVQHKCFDEIRNVIGDDKEKPVDMKLVIKLRLKKSDPKL